MFFLIQNLLFYVLKNGGILILDTKNQIYIFQNVTILSKIDPLHCYLLRWYRYLKG